LTSVRHRCLSSLTPDDSYFLLALLVGHTLLYKPADRARSDPFRRMEFAIGFFSSSGQGCPSFPSLRDGHTVSAPFLTQSRAGLNILTVRFSVGRWLLAFVPCYSSLLPPVYPLTTIVFLVSQLMSRLTTEPERLICFFFLLRLAHRDDPPFIIRTFPAF